MVNMPSRNPGRPAAGTSPLDRSRILTVALELIESRGTGFSWRSLAGALDVDAMALYRYFSGKDALLEAVAEARLAPLWDLVLPGEDWRKDVEALAEAYLKAIAEVPELVRRLAQSPAADSIAQRFQAKFDEATGPLPWSEEERKSACGAFVDLVQGMALAGPMPTSVWKPSLDWLIRGFAATRSTEGNAFQST